MSISPTEGEKSGSAVDIFQLPPHGLKDGWLQQVDTIFFSASRRSFPPGPEREAFRERWLGRYLDAPDDPVLLAVSGATVAGYLVGALANPAEQDRFDDIAYFKSDFREACARYPAHLHINLAAGFRNRGIGAQLIGVFATLARAAGAPGIHVVTGRDMRNVRFYERCGFSKISAAPWNGQEVVFLGKALDHRQD